MTGEKSRTGGGDTVYPPQHLAGELRPYPAYKKSEVEWLGDVPSHWQVFPGRACYVEKKEPNNGLKETTVLSLSYGKIVVKPIEKLHGLVPESFETYQIVNPGDIVIRPTDLQNDWNSLRFGLSHNRGIITSAYMCFRTKENLDIRYGHLLLHTYDLNKVFYGLGSGLRQNLDWRDFKYLPCLVPPRSEQSSIVKFLDRTEKRIRHYIHAKRKLIELLNEQKQAIIDQAVTRGINPNVRLKQTGEIWFEEIPEDWSMISLGNVCTQILDGPHVSPEYVDNGIMFISARNIKRDSWALDSAKFISVEDYELFSKRIRPEYGDVLYTKGGTTGIARAVDFKQPFHVWVHVAILKLKKNIIDPFYLAYILNSPRCYDQSQLFTKGATNQDLGLNKMPMIRLCLPPLEAQLEITKHLDKIIGKNNAIIEKTRQEIELIREYHARLISDVVTGKVDVRNIEIPEEAPVDDDLDQDRDQEYEEKEEEDNDKDENDGGDDDDESDEGDDRDDDN